MKNLIKPHINKINGEAAKTAAKSAVGQAGSGLGEFLSGLAESAVPYASMISNAFETVGNIAGSIVEGITERTKAHTEAFNKGLDSNNEVLIRNHVSQETNVGFYIIIGILVLILILGTTKK